MYSIYAAIIVGGTVLLFLKGSLYNPAIIKIRRQHDLKVKHSLSYKKQRTFIVRRIHIQ
jgi:hypothetical protein